MIRHSKYWDLFNERLNETVGALKKGKKVEVRRVAVFITEKCNFRCRYCNIQPKPVEMSQTVFEGILDKYGKSAIIHITGGEPSTVKWLYPFLKENGDFFFRFHLNTNAYIVPPADSVKRLKISLDSNDAIYWDSLVRKQGAFKKVVDNIDKSSRETVTTITYTLTKENCFKVVEFAEWAQKRFPNLYAIFFSVYKGTKKIYFSTTKRWTNFIKELCQNY